MASREKPGIRRGSGRDWVLSSVARIGSSGVGSVPPIEVLRSYGEVALWGRADGLVRQVERAVGRGEPIRSAAARWAGVPSSNTFSAAAEQRRV